MWRPGLSNLAGAGASRKALNKALTFAEDDVLRLGCHVMSCGPSERVAEGGAANRPRRLAAGSGPAPQLDGKGQRPELPDDA